MKEQIKSVAKAVKKEVSNVRDTYEQWPPYEEDLVQSKTVIPPLLEDLITKICSSASKSRLRQRKQRIISSICQDIIYNARNGRYRCSKHAVLGLCLKRKTGSRAILEWFNRLGHSTSYDEVNYLETSLAVEAIGDEDLKTYCPSTLLPSTFVTFVWDNNDINPESIKGKLFFSN